MTKIGSGSVLKNSISCTNILPYNDIIIKYVSVCIKRMIYTSMNIRNSTIK